MRPLSGDRHIAGARNRQTPANTDCCDCEKCSQCSHQCRRIIRPSTPNTPTSQITSSIRVSLSTPTDPERTSGFLNVRVADIARVYQEWSAKGAEFLTEPKDHGREIRAYLRDPDGHLIEVGQVTGLLD